jgi:protein TonB
MDEYLTPQSSSYNTRFGRWLVVSLLLHAIAFIPFLIAGHGRINATAVKYLDLNMIMNDQSSSPVIPSTPPPSLKEAPSLPPPTAQTTEVSELEKLQGNVQKTLEAASALPTAIQEASLGLGMTSGYFSSIAEGQSLRGDIREYYFEMLRCINEKWWLNKDGKQGGARQARFYLFIARDGTIINKILVSGSGNPACDKAMMETLDAASPFPPLPATYQGEIFQAPLRFNAPLNLMGSFRIG